IGVAVPAAFGVAVGGAPMVVLAAAAILAIAACALPPVGTLLLAEARPETPMGLVMGLNASAATAGQIFGPIAGYAAFGLAGPAGLGAGCLALGLAIAAASRFGWGGAGATAAADPYRG